MQPERCEICQFLAKTVDTPREDNSRYVQDLLIGTCAVGYFSAAFYHDAVTFISPSTKGALLMTLSSKTWPCTALDLWDSDLR